MSVIVVSEPSLENIRVALREALPAWREEYGLTRLRVFGSLARGDASPVSDLDLLADFTGQPDVFMLARLKLDIEDRLGRRVDLVMERGLRPGLRERVLHDAVTV